MDPLLTRRRRLPEGVQTDGEQPDLEPKEESLQLSQELAPMTPMRSTTAEQGPSTSQDRASGNMQHGDEEVFDRGKLALEVATNIPKAFQYLNRCSPRSSCQS